MGLLDDAKQVGSGLANAATGAGRAVKDVGSAVIGAERTAASNVGRAVGNANRAVIGVERNAVGTVADGISRVAADVASAAHKVSTYARGSENHAGSAPNTPNHQGVSHAPNAGPAMQGHLSKAPRPYQENNLPSIPSTGVLPGPAGAGRKVQTSTVKGPSASDMANIAANAKAKK